MAPNRLTKQDTITVLVPENNSKVKSELLHLSYRLQTKGIDYKRQVSMYNINLLNNINSNLPTYQLYELSFELDLLDNTDKKIIRYISNLGHTMASFIKMLQS